MSRRFPVALCVSLWALTVSHAAPAGLSDATPDAGASFTADGRLRPPANYREWIFLTSGLDMSYRKDSASNH